jgi:hypothetical protein
VDGCGLARAVRTKKAKNFPFLDIEADSVDSREVAVFLDEVMHFQNRRHNLSPLR